METLSFFFTTDFSPVLFCFRDALPDSIIFGSSHFSGLAGFFEISPQLTRCPPNGSQMLVYVRAFVSGLPVSGEVAFDLI